MPTEYSYEYQTLPSDMDQIAEQPEAQKLEGFNFLFGVTELVGGFLIILLTVWTASKEFRGGFAWRSDPAHEFNWHPLLMTLGLVFLYSNGMLIYRIQRRVRKRRLKLIHAGIMMLCVLFTIIGLVAAFDSHNLRMTDGKPDPIPNMYTLHSWVGLTTVLLFCCQWAAGFISFLYPGTQPHLRTAYMPVHVYFGIAGFVGAIASCLLGLNEKAFFSLPDGKYSQFPTEGILINTIGLTLIIFGGLSVYLISQDRYKRLPRPEDEVLLAERSN